MNKKLRILSICFLSFSSVFSQNNSWNLDSCISYAVSHNIQISQSYLQQTLAEEVLKQSKYERLPSLHANASQTFSSAGDNSNMGIQADMTIFSGNAISNTIKQNELQTKQKESDIQNSKLQVIIAVTDAYIQCLYYKENIDITQKILESSNQELEITKAKYEAGAISSKELSDILSQNATNEYNVIKAQNQYNKQILTLKQLMELPPNKEISVKSPVFSVDSIQIPLPESVYANALQYFPEIQSAKYQSSIDSLGIAIAKSAYFPSVTASTGISSNITEYANNPITEIQDNVYKMAQIKLSIPIFNNYSKKLSVTSSRISLQSNALQLESTKKELYKKIENTYIQAVASQAEIKSLTQVYETSKTAYDLTRELYNVGATTTTNLLVSQTNYSNAGISLLQAKYLSILYYQYLLIYQGKSISL